MHTGTPPSVSSRRVTSFTYLRGYGLSFTLSRTRGSSQSAVLSQSSRMKRCTT